MCHSCGSAAPPENRYRCACHGREYCSLACYISAHLQAQDVSKSNRERLLRFAGVVVRSPVIVRSNHSLHARSRNGELPPEYDCVECWGG